MSGAAHTPGPWVVNPIQLNQVCTHDAAHEVAFVTVLHPAAVTVANAQLIAAAPELLDLARLVLRGLKSGAIKAKPIMDMDPNAASVDIRPLAEIAGHAISKATGGRA